MYSNTAVRLEEKAIPRRSRVQYA